jgi:hypothetical protein
MLTHSFKSSRARTWVCGHKNRFGRHLRGVETVCTDHATSRRRQLANRREVSTTQVITLSQKQYYAYKDTMKVLEILTACGRKGLYSKAKDLYREWISRIHMT